jgi:Kae1-associated kinase Bud32
MDENKYRSTSYSSGQSMKIIQRGAEAIIYRTDDEIVKHRIKKGYRCKELDIELRKRRTKSESKLMIESRRIGVPTPKIIEIRDFEIVMEFINGEKVKDILDKIDKKIALKICDKIGLQIAKLHNYDIIHGDLTTSNFIFHPYSGKNEFEIYFIDFGLGFYSNKIEDKAYDLYLLKQAIKTTHFINFKWLWNKIIKSYKKGYKDSDKVIKHFENIEKRGRYKHR